MIVTFDKDYLRELYETGKTDKKHRFQPDIIKRYQKRIDTLKRTLNVEELFTIHSLNYEVMEQSGYFIHKSKRPIPNRIYRFKPRSRNNRLYLQYIRIVKPL